MRPHLLFVLLFPAVYATLTCEGPISLPHASETVEQHGVQVKKTIINVTAPVMAVYDLKTTASELSSLSWTHNSNPIPVYSNTDHDVYYTTQEAGDGFKIKLHIKVPSPRVSGIWGLTTVTASGKETTICEVMSPPVIRSEHGTVRGHEGYPLKVLCEVEGFPVANEVTWAKVSNGEATPITDATFKEHDNVKNAIMEWSDATGRSGLYKCTVRFGGNEDNLLIQIRIKSKYAPLWPTIGIISEAILLAVIILISERAQYKRRQVAEASQRLKSNDEVN